MHYISFQSRILITHIYPALTTEVKILKASHGDCFLVLTSNADGKDYSILIDGGPSETFDNCLTKELRNKSALDLIVLTHIDSDHIGGLISFLKSNISNKIDVGRYWVNGKNLLKIANGKKISFKEGKTFEKLMIEKKIPSSKWSENVVAGNTIELSSGITATILSPTQEILSELHTKWGTLDGETMESGKKIALKLKPATKPLIELANIPYKPAKSISNDLRNASSIAFILNLLNSRLLFLADSRPEVILESLMKLGYSKANKLKVDLVKVSHHGSRNNTSTELLDIIECDKYIISTNGGKATSRHPERETIARIIFHPARNIAKNRQIYLNYPLASIQLKTGQILSTEDFENGNWIVIDNANSIIFQNAEEIN